MKLELSFDYRKLLKRAGEILNSNKIIVTSGVVLIIGVFVLQRINQHTAVEVDQSYKNKRLSEIDRVEFDNNSIDAIKELNSSSIDITSNFTERNNPFVDN